MVFTLNLDQERNLSTDSSFSLKSDFTNKLSTEINLLIYIYFLYIKFIRNLFKKITMQIYTRLLGWQINIHDR